MAPRLPDGPPEIARFPKEVIPHLNVRAIRKIHIARRLPPDEDPKIRRVAKECGRSVRQLETSASASFLVGEDELDLEFTGWPRTGRRTVWRCRKQVDAPLLTRR